jgi:hypothetical protein
LTKKTSSRDLVSTRIAMRSKRSSGVVVAVGVAVVEEHLRRLQLSLELLQQRMQSIVDYLVRSLATLERKSQETNRPLPAASPNVDRPSNQ